MNSNKKILNKKIFALGGKNWNRSVGAGFLIAALLLSAAGNLFAQEGNITKRLGLFIGSNNGGRGRVVLRYALSDARAVSRVFGDMGGIAQADNIILSEPTVADINRQLDAMGKELSSARKNNQRTELVFYYSGHSDENGLLLNRQLYSYRDLRDRINRMDTDMRIVILDSCSSGAITRAKGGQKTPPFLFDSSVSVEGYAYLTSSSSDEASQESDSIESSYFTHSLLAGLRGAADTVGDGKVTLNELYRFAYSETLAKTETSLYGAQHPSYDMQLSGSGDVVLTDINETSASLLIGEDLTGRITIRDASDYLVAELTKVNQKPIELGLAPGLYRIMLQVNDNFYRTEMTLKENTRTPLKMGDFSRIASAPGRSRSRGSSGEASSDTVNDDESSRDRRIVYSFFYNNVPEMVRFPLFGFINISRGEQYLPQVGFINWNHGDFSTIQAGFINTAWGDVRGLQGGFVNTAREITGSQIGFANTALGGGQGFQLGFVNASIQKFRGVQLGFVNYADSIDDGIPIGFISIVRHGGYRAIEYGFSEFYPAALGFKLGVEKFYTSIFCAYNPNDKNFSNNFAWGLGFGSIIPLGSAFYLNPEITSISPISMKEEAQFNTFVPYLGFNITRHFSVCAGPSVTWVHCKDGDETEPLFSIKSFEINDRHTIVLGARAALRFRF